MKVAKGNDGLVHFTLQRTLKEPTYLVARLDVYHAGKLIGTSSTPLYGKKGRFGNTFYFAIAAEDVAESRFSISESYIGKDSDEAVPPAPGGTIYQFKLSDFVPKDVLKSVPVK